jgi:hypothetical protein
VRIVQLRLGFRKLNEVTRDKTCGDAQIPKTFHKQPRGVATRARVLLKGLLRCLHSMFQPDDVINPISHPSIQVQQKVDRSGPLVSAVFNEAPQQIPGRICLAEGTNAECKPYFSAASSSTHRFVFPESPSFDSL